MDLALPHGTNKHMMLMLMLMLLMTMMMIEDSSSQCLKKRRRYDCVLFLAAVKRKGQEKLEQMRPVLDLFCDCISELFVILPSITNV